MTAARRVAVTGVVSAHGTGTAPNDRGEAAFSNSVAFGGLNAVLAFRRPGG